MDNPPKWQCSTPKPSGFSSAKQPTYSGIKRKASRNISSPKVSPVSKRFRSPSVTSYRSSNSSVCQLMDEIYLSDATDSSQIIQTLKPKMVKCGGHVYALLKPKSINSLYAQIIKNSPKFEQIISAWIYLYETDAKLGMEFLLSFFVNIMGFQNIEIDFNSNDFNFINLRNKLEQKVIKAHQNLICVFRNTSTFAKTCVVACHTFLQDLVLACDRTQILYQSTFLGSLLNFILEMSKSKNRIIIITICSMALKILTSLLRIEKRFKNMYILDETQKIYLKTLSEVNQQIKVILLHYSNIQDMKLSLLRQRSAEEFLFWIALSDDMKFSSDILNKLKKLVIDNNAPVRIAALRTCKTIVEKGYLDALIKDNVSSFKALCNVIVGRINDINPNVEIMAIQFFKILEQNETTKHYVNTDVQNKVLEELYSQTFKVAKESAMFLESFVKGEQMLKVVLELAKKFDEEDNVALLVHAIMGSFPETFKLDGVINLILRNSTSAAEKEWLLKIIYHYANIGIKGELGHNRDEINLDISNMANEYIGEIMLLNFANLVREFCEDEQYIQWILKTLNIVDILNPTFIKHREIIKHIVKCLIYLMDNYHDLSILVLISEILSKLTDEDYTFGPQHSVMFSTYLDKLIDEYENNLYISKQETIITEELYTCIRDGIYRLSIITEHHNIVHKLVWNNIYSEWENGTNTDEIVKFQIKCCKNYLKWKMHSLIEVTTENEHNVPALNDHIKIFLSSCEEVLNTDNLNERSVVAFRHVCEFLLDYNKIKIQLKSETLCKMLNFAIGDHASLMNKLDDFVLKSCFTEVLGSVSTRKKFLCKYLSLAMNGIINVEKTFVIMKFYYLFKEEYKSIYDFIFSTLTGFSSDALNTYVFKTLLHGYLAKEKEKQQVALSNCFADDLPKSKCHSIVLLGLAYITRHEEHINFIVIMKPFTRKFFRIDKVRMLEFIHEKFSADYLENAAFSLFINGLKPKGTSRIGSASLTRRSSIRSTRSELSYSEFDEDDYTIEEVDD